MGTRRKRRRNTRKRKSTKRRTENNESPRTLIKDPKEIMRRRKSLREQIQSDLRGMIMINNQTEIDPETITTGTMTGAASVPIIIRVITSKVSTNSMIEVREASEEGITTEIIEVTIEITEVIINITNGKEEVIEMIIGGKIEGGIITTEEITEIMMKTPSQVILMAKIPDPLSTVKKSDPAATGGRQNRERRGSLVLMKLMLVI